MAACYNTALQVQHFPATCSAAPLLVSLLLTSLGCQSLIAFQTEDVSPKNIPLEQIEQVGLVDTSASEPPPAKFNCLFRAPTILLRVHRLAPL